MLGLYDVSFIIRYATWERWRDREIKRFYLLIPIQRPTIGDQAQEPGTPGLLHEWQNVNT